MSLDLYQRETLERVSQMPVVQEPEPSAFESFWRGAGLTTMKNLARVGRAVDMAGAFGPIVQDAFTGGTEAQDQYFKEHDEIWGSAVDYWTPRPREVGVAGQITGEILSMLPLVIASPHLAIGAAQLGTAEDLVRKGVDATKAQAVGAVQGAGLGLGIWMPILGQNLWQRVVVGGAGFNLVQGVGMRAASGMILEGTEAAKEFQAFDGTALTLDVLLGAAFGGIVHLSPAQRAQGAAAWQRITEWAGDLSHTQKAAIATLRLAQHLNLDSTPGIPAGPVDVEAHVNRVRTAIEQLERGQPVEVSGISEPRFEPDGRLSAMQKRAEELVARAPKIGKAEGIPPIQESALDIAYNRGLSPEFDMVQQRFARQILADVDGAIRAYEKHPDSDGGKILNVDVARELSPDYNASLEARARYSPAVHEPASALVKEMYKRRLEQPDPTGLDMVTFTAGGTGAGKTGAIAGTPMAAKIAHWSQIVYDTNMAGFKSAVDKIDQALAAGKQVNILWVGRDPVDALRGAITRAKKIGRSVPLEEHAKTHVGAAATVERLVEHYQGNQKVQFVFLDNAGAKGEVTVAGPELARSYNFNNLELRLKEALDAEYQKGTVPDHVYQGFAGHAPGEAGGGPGRAGEGKPAAEHGTPPRHRKGIPREYFPREEVGPDRPPAPGESFLVFRLGEQENLTNRNAGNADAVARHIMSAEDPESPLGSLATKVFAYEVKLDEGQPGFGEYVAYNAGRANKKAEGVGRTAHGAGQTQVSYSFPEKGYKAKVLGVRTLDYVRTKLKNAGFASFDEADSTIGARAIREAFTESEAPPAKPGGSEPPPPRGSRQAEAGGAEGTGPDPVRAAADQVVEANPERLIRVGTNPDGSPVVRSAKDYIDEARGLVKQAKSDVALFEAAALCLIGRA